MTSHIILWNRLVKTEHAQVQKTNCMSLEKAIHAARLYEDDLVIA